MKKILSVLSCGLLAACMCNDSQWEEVEVIKFDETIYEQPKDIIVEPKPIFVQAPQLVKDCPCVEQMPCQVAHMPCCQHHSAPVSQPKVTTTKKIITTTTTLEEPCGKPVCEPVITVHEEIVSSDEEPIAVEQAPVKQETVEVNEEAQVVVPEALKPEQEYLKVTVKKNPYRSEIVDMRKTTSSEAPKQMVKYSPEAYNVVATRATNRMLQDTAVIYENGVKRIYIKDAFLMLFTTS